MTDARAEIAILVPCRDEAASIVQLVHGLRLAVPHARIYVYDNASTDRTKELATEAGAIVRVESLLGKGHVVRRMFADVDADVFILIDGDGTYLAQDAARLAQLVVSGPFDMVTGRRVASASAYPSGHRLGNVALTRVVRTLFGAGTTDLLSGYRAFSRRFVKTFPALSTGFEIETELTVHALELGMPVHEIDVDYRSRDSASASKLRTIPDGLRILGTIALMTMRERPTAFFGVAAAVLLAAAGAGLVPVLREYAATGLVPKFPTLIVAATVTLAGVLSLFTGLILDSVHRGRVEMRRLAYLAVPGPEHLTLAGAQARASSVAPASGPQVVSPATAPHRR